MPVLLSGRSIASPGVDAVQTVARLSAFTAAGDQIHKSAAAAAHNLQICMRPSRQRGRQDPRGMVVRWRQEGTRGGRFGAVDLATEEGRATALCCCARGWGRRRGVWYRDKYQYCFSRSRLGIILLSMWTWPVKCCQNLMKFHQNEGTVGDKGVDLNILFNVLRRNVLRRNICLLSIRCIEVYYDEIIFEE
jgi:hypothetical protein